MHRMISQAPPNFAGRSGVTRFRRKKSRSLRESSRPALPRCRGARFSKSRAPQPRKIEPEYFVVTHDRIALLNEENIPAAIQRISALDKPPEFEPDEIYGITSGSFNHEDGLWKTIIRLKGDLCVYEASHPSGHFRKVVWKKGVGLVEHASGYGARADGYRLKRTTARHAS